MARPCTLDAHEDTPRGYLPFGGKQINIHQIAKQEGMDYGYLWRIFRGERPPSLSYSRRLAVVLDMTIDQLLNELEALQQKS